MKYSFEIDEEKCTTLVNFETQQVELPFILYPESFEKGIDPYVLAGVVCDIFLAGFKVGYDSAEFDNEDEILRARLGDNY